MDLESLSEVVKKALEYYDNQNLNYKKLISNQNSIINDTDNTITFLSDDGNEIYDIEILGYFDNQNNIWVWGWLLYSNFNYNNSHNCKYLLDYGLKLDKDNSTLEQLMIRSILVNSRIKIEEQIQLDINLSIYSYLIKDKLKFIYAKKRNTDKTLNNYVTFYYMIK